MRPGDFSPGNAADCAWSTRTAGGFNEAGGFLPRKLHEGLRIYMANNKLQ